MKRLAGIDYSNDLQKTSSEREITLKSPLGFIMPHCVFSGIIDFYELVGQLFSATPICLANRVMGYFFIFFITSIYLVNKLYGKRLKELEELLGSW